jgi:hypothetical protein
VKKKETPKHQTTWQDGGTAGFECNGKEAGMLDAGEWAVCGECGKDICLSWKVSIIEKRKGAK